MYIRRRAWKYNIPLDGCQGHAPAGWLLSSPPALNLGTASSGASCFKWHLVSIVGMDGSGFVAVPFALQIGRHAAVAVDGRSHLSWTSPFWA